MPNSENLNSGISRDLSTHTEEEDLWDLNDDWDDDSTDSPSTSDAPPTDEVVEPETPETATTTTSIGDKHLPTEEPKPSITEEIEDKTTDKPAIASTDPEEPTQPEAFTPPLETTAPEAADHDQSVTSESPTATPKNRLSIIEKVTLSLVAISLLGLAIYGYIWLYGKNLKTDDTVVELPITGEHTTISAFSTYWTTAGQGSEVKRGAHVLPAASITLDSNSNSSDAAIRIYFRNAKNTRVGDTITLGIKNGKFTPSTHSNITIKDEGATAEINASDGFHQEGDFSAYALDNTLSWKIFVLEAHSPSAAGNTFTEMIETKVLPKRK